MFTGIVNAMGAFGGFRRGRQELWIKDPGLGSKMGPGDSLAVDGTCLTLVRKEAGSLVFDVSRETLGRTSLGSLKPGTLLNLELPLTPSSFIGGHLVSGHIDGTGKVIRLVRKAPGKRLAVSFASALRPYFVLKGSVAVNGVSLTIAGLEGSSFEAELIPLTLETTNLGGLRGGDAVNLECDIVGKYVYNFACETPWKNRAGS
jgi:riboflavin synthase